MSMQLANSRWGRLIRSLILVVLLSCLSGCFTVKVHRLSWPGLDIRKEVSLFHIGAGQFYALDFNMNSDTIGFSVQMPDGKVLTSDRLTPETLAPYVTPFDQLDSKVHPSWSNHMNIIYDNGSVRVFFEESRLARVAIFVNRRRRLPNESVPGIGNATGDKIFFMPITKHELIELYGEPSSAHSYLFNT